MERSDKNWILEVNLLYLILGLLLLLVGSIVQSREIYSGLLITEYIIILLPNLLYIKLRRLSFKQVLRLNKISLKQGLYTILIVIFSYPVAIFLNTLMMTVLSFFGELIPNTVPIPDSLELYIISLLIIAISPGICEEVMFRGTIMNAYGGLGKKKAIIISAVLFGLFHLNIQNLVGPIFLGIIFGIIAYKTNSLYSSILAHTVNNSIAMTIGYFAMKSQGEVQDVPAYEIPHQVQMLILLVVIGIFALGSLLILMRLLKKLPQSESTSYEEIEYKVPLPMDYLPIMGIVALFVVLHVRYLFL